MAGRPWEKYQAQKATGRPWEKYKKPSILTAAKEDVKQIGKSLMSLPALGQRLLTAPSRGAISGAQVAQGIPFSETGTAEDVEIAKSVPTGLYERGKELVTDPVGSFKRQPVSTTLDVMAVAAPVLRAARPILGTARMKAAGALTDTAQSLGTRARGVKPGSWKTPEDLARVKTDTQLALDKKILSPFASSETMLERAVNLSNQVGERIGQYLKSQGFKFNSKQALNDLDRLSSEFPKDPAVLQKINDAKTIIKDTLARDGSSFEAANKLKSYLQEKVDYGSNRASQKIGKGIARKFRKSIDSQLDDVSSYTGDQKQFQQFLDDKKSFGSADRLEKSLLKRYRSEQGGNLVGIRETALGAGEMIATGNPTKAAATAGIFKIGSRYAGQIGAVAADRLSRILRNNPKILGKYAGVLENAASKGSASLASTHETLQQADPEYRQVVGRIINFPQKPKKILKKAG